MYGFWIGAAVISVICVAALLPSLSGKRRLVMAQRSEHTVQAAKTRLTELEADLAKQDITQAQFDLARADLETALSDELRLANDGHSGDNNGNANSAAQSGNRLAAIWLAVIPIVAFGVYMTVGQPDAGQLAQQTESPEQNASNAIAALERRLLDTPEDAEGWLTLGRSFMATRQYDEAARAFSRLNKLTPENLDVTAQYAGALALSVGSFSGKPQTLLQEVLSKSPDHPQGLWLAAMAARTQGDVQSAIASWMRLLNAPATDETMRAQIRELLAQANAELGQASSELLSEPPDESSDATLATQPAEVDISLTVSVSLDDELSKNVSPQDTLFIFARAVDGPPMPLAAAKQTVADLPIVIALDDSMAMTPMMKLSGFDTVEVVARISKSGTPTKQPGDLEGVSQVISLPTSETVNLRIDRVLP